MLSPATLLMHCTTRIEAVGNNLNASLGTGFFYHLPSLVDGEFFPAIITNKHVIEGAHTVNLQLQISPLGVEPNDDGTAAGEQRWAVSLALTNLVVSHPNPDIDLCAIMIAPILNSVPNGMNLKHMFLNSSWRLNEDEAPHIRPI
ncbi:MAG: hypothetical protein AB1807_15100 [Pseudomonadota bacterium]